MTYLFRPLRLGKFLHSSTQICLLATLICVALPVHAQERYPDANRVVSVGSAVTEIVYALGEEDRLVARDTTSSFPAAAKELPDVGYMRRLSPEGILSVNPDLILTEPGSGPAETIELLGEAQIPFVPVPGGYDAEGILTRVTTVAQALGVEEKGAALVAQLEAELEQAIQAASNADYKPRVLFVLSMPGGRLNVAGLNTRADGIIKMAGAVNAVQEFTEYRTLTDEAIVTSAPDVVLMMSHSANHGATSEDLWAHPALSLTPAGKNKALIAMSGSYLLGFGPRTANAVADLRKNLDDLQAGES
ncbi:iron complex transport system substrate-binding protein [Aliiroseovarius halocynthiae]|uniref:ABC transporter substrate-binding protein n=1 Tax=Aliiroseovarius halocynthiae TaxID=985055 RepID=A0A545SNX6_9RHOB|nr:ABC transporter substrate-binding protein [Aliiroseovarius halocynthiae]TQV66675.1 ABC transporter substrate-binding protein [Aliiroseovarius halocynthiae]SMR82446.1 iron complex transport system substrate-binding protein [Aliiroseovarius halocynthiae]